jgi:hypothetical protein
MTNQGSGNAYTTSGTHLCLELAAQAQLNFAAGRKSGLTVRKSMGKAVRTSPSSILLFAAFG